MMFRSRSAHNSMPEVNLVPMMDVIMTILTFFIIVSMTLTNFQSVDLSLPGSQQGVNRDAPPDPLVVGVSRQGQLMLQNQIIDQAQLDQAIAAYLQKNPKGSILLQADKNLPYQQVVTLLGQLKQRGGERVSLAIE
jgi:biopolymer transport protein ExbD